MRFALALPCTLALLLAGPAGSDSPLPWSDPAAIGMSAAELDRIPQALQRWIDDGSVAGAVSMVARRGRLVHWEAVGYRDLGNRVPLERTDIFRICSMTKPVTSVAVMMLVDAGALTLDEPVSRTLPEFGRVRVHAAGELVDPSRPITIRDLLRHTSGLTYGLFGDTHVDTLYRAANVFSGDLENLVSEAAGLPLLAHPGARWNYGVSTDVLGRVVEVLSGQTLDAFFATRIFKPLGMRDTAFVVPPEQAGRFTTAYTRRPDGALAEDDVSLCGVHDAPPELLSGGAGLVSTAGDYVRFAQMLLNGGTLDGVRLLQPETVREMRTNQLPDYLIPIRIRGDEHGYGFGLGFSVLTDADATPHGDNDGVFRWRGYASTYFWIDPEADLIGVLLTQLAPPTAPGIEREFQTTVYEALTAGAPASR